MGDYKQIFRAYDIRGKIPEELNAGIAYKIRLSLAQDFSSTALSYDVRKTSPALANALLAGFLEGGGDVVFQGLASFGVALYSGYLEKTDITTYISASHLPPEYNGVKLYYSDGLALSSDDISKIGERLEKIKRVDWRNYGVVEARDHTREYIEFFSSRYSLEGKVAVDCGGGATSLVARDVFEGVGLKVDMIFCKPNPALADRSPEPDPDSLVKLRKTVQSGDYLFGVAFDGDGDRVAVLDEKGNPLTSEQVAIILARDLLEENGKALVLANTECSSIIEDILVPLGAEVKRIPVGHSYLTHYARELKADIGVEASGHFLLPNILPFDDAMPTPMELARIVGDGSLSELASDIPVYPRVKLNIPVSDREKFEIVERLKERLVEEYDVNTMDGIKVFVPGGWILIRASNTEPKIRLLVEARDEDTLNELANKFRSLVEELA